MPIEDAYAQACADARRTGEPLSLLMVDADHFKRINDKHGHSVGDEVLKGFGHLPPGRRDPARRPRLPDRRRGVRPSPSEDRRGRRATRRRRGAYAGVASDGRHGRPLGRSGHRQHRDGLRCLAGGGSLRPGGRCRVRGQGGWSQSDAKRLSGDHGKQRREAFSRGRRLTAVRMRSAGRRWTASARRPAARPGILGGRLLSPRSRIGNGTVRRMLPLPSRRQSSSISMEWSRCRTWMRQA